MTTPPLIPAPAAAAREGGGEKIDENVPMDGMDGGDMPAENDTVTDDGGSVTNSTVTVLPDGRRGHRRR